MSLYRHIVTRHGGASYCSDNCLQRPLNVFSEFGHEANCRKSYRAFSQCRKARILNSFHEAISAFLHNFFKYINRVNIQFRIAIFLNRFAQMWMVKGTMYNG